MKGNKNEFLTFTLSEQLFGVSVLDVTDVVVPRKITRPPLSPPCITGVMNLRGRIVTAIDLRTCLGLPPFSGREEEDAGLSIVIERQHELFSLIIDKIGDVIHISTDNLEDTPPTLDSVWRKLASHIYKMEDRLLVILDIDRLLEVAKQ